VLAKPILPSPSSACQANTLESRSRARTVKLLVPGIKLQAASHSAHRYISASAIPMPLFESQAVVPVHRYSHAALFFPGDLVGPEALLRSAASCIIFSGYQRARRLRHHRHRMSDWPHGSRWSCWSHRSSPLSSYYIFQAGGAPSRPWQKRLFVPGDLDPITLVSSPLTPLLTFSFPG
jgi:hypothetical protein